MIKPVSPTYAFRAYNVVLILLLFSQVVSNEAMPSAFCPDGNTYRPHSRFEVLLQNLLSNLPDNTISAPGMYFKQVVGANGADQIFSLALCRGDSDTTKCSDCLRTILLTLQQDCRYKKEAFVFYEFCTFRYSNTNFLGSTRNRDIVVSARSEGVPAFDPRNRTFLSSFKGNLKLLLNTTARLTVDNSTIHWFFTSQLVIRGSNNSIYGLMQCTPDYSANNCLRCLEDLMKIGEMLYESSNGAVFGVHCFYRFEMYPFYIGAAMKVIGPVEPPQQEPGHSGTRKRKTVLIIILIVAVLLLTSVMFLAIWCYWKKRHGGSSDSIEANEVGDKYSYKVLKVATQNFANGNELGRGGYGTVYKGTLKNGRTVAVKRIRDTKTSLEELHREIQLLCTLRHQNLVRLLGHCFQKKARMFVYEYLPNGDLESFCTKGFRPNSIQQKHDWSILLKIIKGVASGLLYLHDNSMVHMDIKPSNVFLDTDFTAKIGDYNLLRRLDPPQTHQTTQNRRGTTGFMSPEFWGNGQWSRQYDVYAFGKLILMIIIEQQQYLATDHGDIVLYVWDHWSAGTLYQILQKFAEGEEREQAHTCVHLALLCLQRDRKLRPAMGRVIDCLNFDVMLEKPNPPGTIKYTKPNISGYNINIISHIQMIQPMTQDEGTSSIEEIN